MHHICVTYTYTPDHFLRVVEVVAKDNCQSVDIFLSVKVVIVSRKIRLYNVPRLNMRQLIASRKNAFSYVIWGKITM